jgi:hypothetical protein
MTHPIHIFFFFLSFFFKRLRFFCVLCISVRKNDMSCKLHGLNHFFTIIKSTVDVRFLLNFIHYFRFVELVSTWNKLKDHETTIFMNMIIAKGKN